MPVFRLSDFSGGLNTRLRQNLIGDNESPAMQNVWWKETGALTKRRGMTILKSVTGLNPGLGRAMNAPKPQTATGAINYRLYVLAIGVGSGISSWFESDTTGSGTYSQITSIQDYHIGSRMEFFAGNLYVNDNTNGLIKYDGSSATNISTALAQMGSIAAWKNFLFSGYNAGIGVTGRSILQWSGLRDPSTWPTNNNVIVGSDDGYVLTAIKPFQDSLVLFKGAKLFSNAVSAIARANSHGATIWQLFGDTFDPTNPTYSLRQTICPDHIACVFQDTVITWRDSLFFLTNDGLYIFNGAIFQKYTEKIQPTVDLWWKGAGQYSDASTTINIVTNEPQAIVYKNDLYLTMTEFTANPPVKPASVPQYPQSIFVFTDRDSIWRWTSALQIQGFTTDFSGTLLGVGNSGTNVILYTMDQSARNDNGTAISASWTSKEFDFKEQQFFKHFYVHFRRQLSGTLIVEYSIDQAPFVPMSIPMSGTKWDVARSARQIIGVMGRTIQFRISNGENNTNFEIYEIEMYHDPKPQMN